MYSDSIIKVLKAPRILFARLLMREPFCKMFSDETYLKISYRLCIGKKLNLNNPKTFTEKIQWLKLHNTSDLCQTLVDKFAVRKYIADTIGENYLIPSLGVWNSFDEINFDELPNQFVLKCTHDSGSVVICKNKDSLNKEAAKKKLTKALNNSFYWIGRERPYKNVPPRIIAEQFMVDDETDDLADFKFFCFNGVPKVLFYASERFKSKNRPAYFDFYDMELNRLDMTSFGHSHNPKSLEYFPQFDEMKRLATILSKSFPHVRVDFYLINGKVYFGEITFHHDGGYVPFQPIKWDEILGSWIDIDGYKC
jgi:hypothetical protein